MEAGQWLSSIDRMEGMNPVDYDQDMTKRGTSCRPESRAAANTGHDPRAADTLAAAIRKPVDALNAAAEEAADGMLGGAKLGLLVAANGLIDALNAVDAEFARQYGASIPERPEVEPGRHDVTQAVSDRPGEPINVPTQSRFESSLWAFASAIGGLCGGIAVVNLCRLL